MPRLLPFALISLLLLAGASAWAVDWYNYSEFRHTSGLPGNGYGITPEGDVGFGGAFHMNVPCAYTPTQGNLTTAYYSASSDSSVRFELGGDKTESTGHVGIGLGKPGHGIYVGEVFVEKDLQVKGINVQVQLLDESVEFPAVAVGCMDLFNEREARPGQPHSARSIYAVATRKVSQEGAMPTYVSIGFGNKRFESTFFGALSFYPTENLMIGGEYDGYIFRPYLAVGKTEESGISYGLGTAWSNLDRPVVGLNVGYTR